MVFVAMPIKTNRKITPLLPASPSHTHVLSVGPTRELPSTPPSPTPLEVGSSAPPSPPPKDDSAPGKCKSTIPHPAADSAPFPHCVCLRGAEQGPELPHPAWRKQVVLQFAARVNRAQRRAEPPSLPSTDTEQRNANQG